MLRRLYIQEWRKPSYREHSPAADAKEDILRELQTILSVDTGMRPIIADVGCGMGWFLPILKDAGYDPFGIDIAENCLDPGPKKNFPLLICPITDIDDSVSADAAICIDVMEHVPDEMVSKSIERIAHLSKFGAVFGISMVVDSGRLHCTVRSPDYWREKLEEHFKVARAEVTTKVPSEIGRHPQNWALWRCVK